MFWLNFVFLISTPMAEFEGNPEIGLISAIYIFGEKLGVLMGIFIALLLISSISSMVFAGPRVSMSMGEDFKLINVLAKKNKNGIPWVAMLVQFLISLILIITSTFESLITYTGFVLNIFTFFTVFGLFIHRKRNPNSKSVAKTWGYPVTPIIFLIFNLWITIFVIYSRPKESLLGFVTLLIGAIFYYFCNKSNKKI